MTDEALRDMLRGVIATELLPLRTKLEALSGLPKTVQDLTDRFVELHEDMRHLKDRDGDHAGAIRGVERTLAKVANALDRFERIADHTLPELVRRIEALSSEQKDLREHVGARAVGNGR